MTTKGCTVDGCPRPHHGRGMCQIHAARVARRGTTRDPLTPLERFLAKVNKTEACWEWTGAKGGGGYGRFWLDGRNVPSHRWSYEHYIGPIPDGLVIDHLCRVRHCVNPAHLEPVTARENTLRSPVAPAALNLLKTRCPRGHEYSLLPPRAPGRAPLRRCRTCLAESARARRRLLKEGAA